MDTNKKEMLTQQLNNLANSNEEFCKAIASAEDAASVQHVLVENGFDVSIKEVEEMYADGVKQISEYINSGAADELTEAQMGEVAGGGLLSGTLRLVVSVAAGFGYGCLCAVAPGYYAGAPYVAGGLATWTTAGYLK